LWVGTSSLYALRDRHDGEVLEESLAGWFCPFNNKVPNFPKDKAADP